MAKMTINIFYLLMQDFIELYEMLPFSENIQNIKMFGVPPNTLP